VQAIVFTAFLPHHGIVSGHKGPPGRKGTMKKTLLAIGLAVATMPLTFAAQAPSTPAAGNTSAPATISAKTKKHVKKTNKTKKSTTPASSTPAAKPAPTK
jgi:hypothetical protein